MPSATYADPKDIIAAEDALTAIGGYALIFGRLANDLDAHSDNPKDERESLANLRKWSLLAGTYLWKIEGVHTIPGNENLDRVWQCEEAGLYDVLWTLPLLAMAAERALECPEGPLPSIGSARGWCQHAAEQLAESFGQWVKKHQD